MTTDSCNPLSSLSRINYLQRMFILVFLLLLCVFSIVAYGTYRCRVPSFEDPLTRSIAGDDSPLNQFIDGWGMLHFWFFAMLAYMFPSCWIELTIAGIIWEIMETIFKERPFYLTECDAKIKENKEGWWYGRWQDIPMNTLGIGFGLLMAKYKAPFTLFPTGFVVIISGHFVLQQTATK